MLSFKLKKCKRVHGLHFAPDGGRLLAVGGSFAEAVEAGVWLDVATGEAAARMELAGLRHAVSPDVARIAVLGSAEDDGITPVRWTTLAGD